MANVQRGSTELILTCCTNILDAKVLGWLGCAQNAILFTYMTYQCCNLSMCKNFVYVWYWSVRKDAAALLLPAPPLPLFVARGDYSAR